MEGGRGKFDKEIHAGERSIQIRSAACCAGSAHTPLVRLCLTCVVSHSVQCLSHSQEPMASTSRLFLTRTPVPSLKRLRGSKLCSNSRSWSQLMYEREAPCLDGDGIATPVRNNTFYGNRFILHKLLWLTVALVDAFFAFQMKSPSRPATSMGIGEDPANERPLTMGSDGKLTSGLPYSMMYKAGDIAKDYLKHNGMKAYKKYTGLRRLPSNEPECRTMWKSVLMNKGTEMYKTNTIIRNPRQERMELEKIVTRFGGEPRKRLTT